MKRNDAIRLVCYAAALIFILFHPVRTILRFSFPSVKGMVFRFPVTAYDPYDPMRGRYVRLNFNNLERNIWLPEKNRNLKFRNRQNIFAVLEPELDCTARIVDLVSERKEIPAGKMFLPVQFLWSHQEYDVKTRKHRNRWTHHIRLPFNRFYLNEKKAPEAEKLLQNRKNKAELTVIIYPDGVYQVKDLVINGKSVRGL